MSSRSRDHLRRTIGFRLALWYSAFFIVGSLLLFALTYFLVAASLRQQDRDGIRARLQELAARYQTGGIGGLKRELALEPTLGRAAPFFVRVADPRDVTVFVELPDVRTRFDVRPLEYAPLPGAGSFIRLPARDDDAALEIASLRLPDGFVLQVGKSTEDRDRFLDRLLSIVAGVTVPVILVGVLGGAFLAARALRPIRHLIHTVGTIGSGAMDARVPVRHTGDELDELSMLFNAMLGRIAALIEGMRGALDTVAHDLRTPVARIRGVAEVALRDEQGLDACRDALADCVEEADHLRTMLNTLMDISEAETGALKLHREPVKVSSLVEDVLDLYRDVAEAKEIALSTAAPDALWWSVDRTRMRQVLANLLDNAIKYTPPGGRVHFAAAGADRAVTVTVKDTGIGMAPDELPHIWDRLYRGDRSRSQRGLGLGLSLVRAIVRAHGGDVQVKSAIGLGSAFTVSLPAASARI